MSTPSPDRTTAEQLLAAAMAEFNAHGFDGTDTNRIARRAGFAPQTFYRWYKDKTAAFIAAYREWEDIERASLEPLLARDAPPEALADAAVAHHRDYLLFRRSLRRLSLEDSTVRSARAESRLRQARQICAWTGRAEGDVELIVLKLLQIERLSDAIAEGELTDMGLTDAGGRAALTGLIAALREPI